MALEFDKFAQEGNEFVNDLSNKLNHAEDRGQVTIVLRSVLHALRDRITIPQSFNFMSQLPFFLKAVYVDQWKYRDQPDKMDSMEEFCKAVEQEQAKMGEREFDWNMSTEEIVKTVLEVISLRYITAGEIHDVVGELPSEIKEIFEGQEA